MSACVLGLDRGRIGQRFWPKVDDVRPGQCWLWSGAKSPQGYGKFSVGGRAGGMVGAHVVSYWLANGPVPDGLEIDHLCRVRHCVNPAHLEAVTHAENSRRSTAGAVNRARQLAIKACPVGHPYDESNTGLRPDGRRRCKACDRARTRRAYDSNPERYRQAARQYRARKAGAA